MNIDEIRGLSARQAVLDFQDLKNNRHKNGFQGPIPDLAKQEDKQGQGWTLKKGILVVKDPHDSNELMDYLESKLQHHSWFETRAQKAEKIRRGIIIETPELPAGYDQYTQLFKSLGYWGKNPAMDVATFINNEDGSLSLQVIIRKFDNKYAFVGGMIDKNAVAKKIALMASRGVQVTPDQALQLIKDDIIHKCQQEFIEEFYSNDLFDKNSDTLREGKKLSQDTLSRGFETLINDDEFARLGSFKAALLRIFQQPGLNLDVRISELKKQLMQLGKQANISDEDLDVFLVRLKCRMYQEYFPAQYQDLCMFLKDNLVIMPETTNESDPRNTQEAFMATTPHYFFIDRKALEQRQQRWLVKPKGGDDALSAKVVRLENLFDKPMFSAHGRIILDMLADKAENDPNFLNNHVLQQQLEAIKQKITQREANELNLLPTTNGAALQTVNAQPQFVVASGQANLNQLNNVLGLDENSMDEPISFSSSAIDARQTLIDNIGAQRYARMEDTLENSRLPASARVVLAKLCEYKKINILLDNSGSMDASYNNLGAAPSTRWKEAHERLKKIMPLLALAGSKVELRLINGGTNTTFDFSKQKLGDTVPAMENALMRALSHIEGIFRSYPNGSTNVNAHFNAMFSANNTDKHLTLFITDGDATDLDLARQTILSRNPAVYPLNVVACTKESNQINWVRDIARNANSGVCMLDDLGTEEVRLHQRHGALIPYSRELWLLLHITAATLGQQPAEGLAVYHQADRVDANGRAVKFVKEQLSQLLGYEVREVDYLEYERSLTLGYVPMAAMVDANQMDVVQAAQPGVFYGYNAQQQNQVPAAIAPPPANPGNSRNLFNFFG